MSLSILTNTSAMQTQISLNNSSNAVSTAMQRLSSGLRINSAADDAAGYAIAQGLTSQVNGLQQASQNVSDATSMVQTADSALNNVQSMLQRVSELAVQYGNGDLSSTDKTDIQDEVNQLTQEIDRQKGSVQFNGINLLDGSAGSGGAVTFQVGPASNDTLTVSFQNIESSSNLGITGFTWANAASGGTVFDLSQSWRGQQHHRGDQQRLVARGDPGRGPEPSPVHRYVDLDDAGEHVLVAEQHPGRQHGV